MTPKASYVWVITSTAADWTEIPINTKILGEGVRKLRQSLTFAFGVNESFDTVLAYAIYRDTFGQIADKLKGKTRLSVLANGALTSIPLGILIVSDPQGKALKNVDWLIKSYAITVISSIYSLKTMRSRVMSAEAKNPMIAFADPVFSKRARAEARMTFVSALSMRDFEPRFRVQQA
jgi:hypothetical protein